MSASWRDFSKNFVRPAALLSPSQEQQDRFPSYQQYSKDQENKNIKNAYPLKDLDLRQKKPKLPEVEPEDEAKFSKYAYLPLFNSTRSWWREL